MKFAYRWCSVEVRASYYLAFSFRVRRCKGAGNSFNVRRLSAAAVSPVEDSDTKDGAVVVLEAAVEYRDYLDHGLDVLSKSKLTVARGACERCEILFGRRLARAN